MEDWLSLTKLWTNLRMCSSRNTGLASSYLWNVTWFQLYSIFQSTGSLPYSDKKKKKKIVLIQREIRTSKKKVQLATIGHLALVSFDIWYYMHNRDCLWDCQDLFWGILCFYFKSLQIESLKKTKQKQKNTKTLKADSNILHS